MNWSPEPMTEDATHADVISTVVADERHVRGSPASVGRASNEASNLLAAEGVRKEFALGAIAALADINLSIRDNELFTLLGPSGCGKTTLLRIFAGFEHPTRGRILLDGRDIAADPPHRRPVNTMFQSYALFPHLTVAENVAFGLHMLRWSRGDIVARVREMLALVQLAPFGARKPLELSGGQQQRVALARALAPRPRVLLLDEPLSALDLKLLRAMQMELKRLQRETAVTFVLVTHDQEEALALSDRIAVMNKGEILQIGDPGQIYDTPRTCFVADFIGEANLIPAGLLGMTAGTVVVRPERVALIDRPGVATRGLPARVVSVTYLGSDTLVELRAEADHAIRARLRGRHQDIEVGSQVVAHWPDDAERLLHD